MQEIAAKLICATNRMSRQLNQVQVRQPPVIHWRSRAYTIPEAVARAAKEHHLKNHPAAVELYNHLLAKIPNAPEIYNNRGAALQSLQRYAEALASFDRAIALKPDYANAYHNRGCALKKLKRPEEALASYDQTIALKPDHAEAYNNRGVILQELKRHEEARASFDRVIGLKPDFAEAYNNRGLNLVIRGDMPEAERMFLKARELKPDFPDPWFNLVNIRKYQAADLNDTRNILALLKKPGLAPDDQEQLHFSLGKIYDDCGLYEEAFKSYQAANQSRNSRCAYDAGATARLTDQLSEVFSEAFMAQPSAAAPANTSPLFIIGMPRAGTTLLANILSNHRAIATDGELSTIMDFAARLPELTGTDLPYPEAVKHISPDLGARLIQDYEQRLRRDRSADRPHVIDKNPFNFKHLGFIARLFPRAAIIHCTRQPLATGLSNYFQRFPLSLDYAFDLRNIGHFYGEYVRLMAHWRKVLPRKLIEISYEEMILNTEPAVRRTLAALGLEWDERCLAPHTNPCVVETASQWQVRQPIYHQSLERWRHYEKQLGPLEEMLHRTGQ